jgi:hypothetical protein
MDVVDVTDVSEVHAAPIFRTELCKVGFCVNTLSYSVNLSRGRRVGIDVSPASIGPRKLCIRPSKGQSVRPPPTHTHKIPATHVPE